jgi:hypothetical protein
MNVIARKLKGVAEILACLPRGEVANFFYLVSKHLPDWLFKFNRGMILVSSSPRLPTRSNPRFTFRKADTDDFEEIARFSEVPQSALHERVKNGDWGYITRDTENEDVIVSVQWIHVGPCFIRGYGLRLDMGDKAAYIYGALSAREVRLLGVFNSAFKRVCEILESEGVSEIVGLVEFFNSTAYNYHLRSNFADIATVTYVSIFGIKFSAWRHADDGRRKTCAYLRRPKEIPWI